MRRLQKTELRGAAVAWQKSTRSGVRNANLKLLVFLDREIPSIIGFFA
jgi:hypothetical protein